MEKTISMSQLAKDAERIARDIEEAGTMYRIRRPGRRSVMLVDADFLERKLATLAFVLRHPNWEQEFEEGRQEFLAGKTIPLDDILEKLGLDEPDAAPRARLARGAPARHIARGGKDKGRGRPTDRSRAASKR